MYLLFATVTFQNVYARTDAQFHHHILEFQRLYSSLIL